MEHAEIGATIDANCITVRESVHLVGARLLALSLQPVSTLTGGEHFFEYKLRILNCIIEVME